MPDDVPPGSEPRPQLRRVRRTPNFARIMITGGVIGVLLGLWVGSRGEGGTYSGATAMGFLAVVFGGLGVLLAGVIAILLDRRTLR
ncbi:hypothetical protein [Luteipulveratus flavus]|uniref:Integral membrane protein n=1 Tax=Luteipulveratus flavus TaxID=3031728 RepID=A0ABT6C9Q4_9MICO|nr:hypothetical protein [Luteipulveratus sp. YIM 133296]MDF8265638.1 hypothetical protein [Luteipulveratus sp. YIM 133296]